MYFWGGETTTTVTMYDSECAGAVKRNRASLLDLREAGAAPDACILLELATDGGVRLTTVVHSF